MSPAGGRACRRISRGADTLALVAGGRIYSVGYEGLTVAGLVERLLQNRIEEVVDVRANPVSRRPGFSKKRLAESLTAAGIAYRHEPLLGNAFRDVDDLATVMAEPSRGGGNGIRRRSSRGGSRSAGIWRSTWHWPGR